MNWPSLRAKDWLRLLGVVAVVVAVIVVEWRSGRIRDFYGDHALQAGIFTGVLLSFAAYFGFDAVRTRLNESRWTPLSRLAFVALAYQTTLVIDVLLWLGSEIAPSNDAEPDDELQEALRQIRRAAHRPAPTHRDLGRVDDDEYRGDLKALLADAAWRRFALEQLDHWKWRNRDGIATWASAMLSTGEAAAVLNRLAQVNESISVTQDWLRALAGQSGYEDRDASIEGARDAWIATLAEAISLREDLTRAGRGLPREYVEFRNVLPPTLRDELARRHASIPHAHAARKTLLVPFAALPAAPQVVPIADTPPATARHT